MDERVWIGLGSNLGDARQIFRHAAQQLAPHLQDLQTSRLYRTRPCGDVHQPDFTNAVIAGYASVEPAALLPVLQEIELRLGKRTLRPNGPRTIDLDLLFWGQRCLRQSGLTLPHPRATARDFVLQPMADLDPQWVDPVSGRTVRELIDDLTEHFFTGEVNPWPE